MELTNDLRATLKEMWRIDKKDKAGQRLTPDEKRFWNKNFKVIENYYENQSAYWHFNDLKNQQEEVVQPPCPVCL